MNRSLLIGYQWMTGLSDTLAGILLYVAPWFTLRLMGIHASTDAAPWVGYIGAFVLSVGLAGLYGVRLVSTRAGIERIETVWLLTAFSRVAVVVYLFKCILANQIEPAWISVVLFDGACVLVQAVGLHKRWLVNAQ
jgi:hypothetical protein